MSELTPIIASAINATAALTTGGFVIFYARRQAKIAANKLALDLFDRRLKCFQQLMKATEDRQEEIGKEKRTSAFNLLQPPADAAAKVARTAIDDFFDAFQDAIFLFGPDVQTLILSLSKRLKEEQIAHSEIDAAGSMEAFEPLFEAYKTAHAETGKARDEVRRAVKPYMMMDRIAVNHPAKPIRWPWSRKPKP